MEFSSITGDPKYLESVRIYNFSQKKIKENEKFVRNVLKLVKKYNEI